MNLVRLNCKYKLQLQTRLIERETSETNMPKIVFSFILISIEMVSRTGPGIFLKNIKKKFQLLALDIRIERTICSILDPEFCEFELCEVKPNAEGIPTFSGTLKLLNGPIRSCIVNTQFYHVYAKNSLLVSNRTWNAIQI